MSKARGAVLIALATVNLLLLAVLASMIVALRGAALSSPTLSPRSTPTPQQTASPAPLAATPPPRTATLLPQTITPLSASILPPASPTASPAATPTGIAASCLITTSGGLISEIQAITAAMPGPASEGMTVPTLAQMAAWERLLRALDQGDTDTGCAILAAEGFAYHIERFTDLPFDDEQYLIVRENVPPSLGWGTVVLRLGAARPLVIEVPHPAADEGSELEAAAIFRQVRARALLLAGTHRCANTAFSPCLGVTMACGQQEPYRQSDTAHATQTMFHAAHRALVPCGGERVAIQLHVNSLLSCPDVFISNGTLNPGTLTLQLYTHTVRRCGDFTIDVADGQADGAQAECGFRGDGVQAVYSNSCGLAAPPDACSGYTSRVYGPETFINIEQSPDFQQDYDCLIDALKEVFE